MMDKTYVHASAVSAIHRPRPTISFAVPSRNVEVPPAGESLVEPRAPQGLSLVADDGVRGKLRRSQQDGVQRRYQRAVERRPRPERGAGGVEPEVRKQGRRGQGERSVAEPQRPGGDAILHQPPYQAVPQVLERLPVVQDREEPINEGVELPSQR
ncbi:hypothetical protein ACHAWF_018233 [Thalassiosira exigua]